MGDPKNN